MSRENNRGRGGRSERNSDRDTGRGRSSSSGRRSFQYKERSRSDVEKRANQSAFDRMPMVKNDIPVFTPKDGTNVIRILPPTWDDASHFGLDVYVHYGVGADKDNLLALHENLNEADPIYEERLKAEKDGDSALATKLKPKKRTAYFLIDRDEEDKGPQIWFAPWTIDKDINAICVDRKSGEVYQIDDPDNGFDVTFVKAGKGKKTEYKGFQLDRRESDLGPDADEWLDFIVENAIPDVLNYMSYEDQDKVFAGGAAINTDEEEEDRGGRGGRGGRDGGRDSGRGGRDEGASRTEGDYDYNEVLGMDFPDLEDIIDAEDLKINANDYGDDEAEDLAKDILDALGIEPPRSRGRGRGDADAGRGRGRGRGGRDDAEEEEEDGGRGRMREMRSRRR